MTTASSPPASQPPCIQPYLLLMLSALSALTPMAIDLYLAAIPAIANSLAAPLHDVEISISLYMIGLSVGQLLGGPFSDFIGRRTSILVGLSIFALASAVIVLSASLEALWFSRLFQALGGGLATINSAAIVRDVSRGREGAANLIRVVQVMMVAPLVAPLLGMVILKLLGWQAIFVFLMVYSLVLMGLFYRYQPETRKNTISGNLFQRYGFVLREKRCWRYLVTIGAAYGSMLTSVTASPGVYMGYFGVSEVWFPVYFSLSVLAMLGFSRINLRLLKQREAATMIGYGQGIQVVLGSVLLMYFLCTEDPSLGLFAAMTAMIVGSHGFLMSNATASTTEYFPDHSGTATALMGALGFAIGGTAGWFTSVVSDGTPIAMVAVMLGASLLGLVMRYVLTPAEEKGSVF